MGLQKGASRSFEFKYNNGNTDAVFTCGRCDKQLSIHNCSGLVPSKLCKKAAERGWVTDESLARLNRCPACQNRRESGDSPGRNGHDALPVLQNFTPPAPIETKEIEGDAAMLDGVNIPIPTQSQRVQIREMVEQHFDDTIGCYEQGWSDRIIAEKVQPPIGAAAVRVLRETAYGPEKVTPEHIKLGQDITAARDLVNRAVKAAESALAAATSALDQAAAAQEMVTALESRRQALLGK